ncbi:hypothetical protein M404DRAFT_1005319 [Pisolithus tinctorius Marx 270]|uniref:Uncharacterized protein n=1 Tax=Pisolithus tinctorius Marx 270 TaxID=870435 RepID=A0A0C3NSJ0_PISTI|nr:hypothetical protein M404DRAFT_1005319 [Pisolithus tinctorius Marx 270]
MKNFPLSDQHSHPTISRLSTVVDVHKIPKLNQSFSRFSLSIALLNERRSSPLTPGHADQN